MGNKQSIPAPELVYRAAKAGNASELEALAREARSLGPEAEGRRRELLEWRDDKGRTPLVVAAGKDQKDCVEVLLQCGANVQHQSMTKEGGGSALHVAVHKQCSKEIIDALLRFGASPFVENAGGFTALDYAIMRKNTALIRRLESLGYFADYLKIKTSALLGLNKKWAPRWVVILPRHPSPYLPANQQMMRKLLLVYNDAQQFEPSSKMYLDGARAATTTLPDSDEKQCVLRLHVSHSPPKGGNLSLGGDSRSGVEVYLRPSSRDANVLNQFVRMVNNASSASTHHQTSLPPLHQMPTNPVPPSGDQRSDAEIAAELSRALNGGVNMIGTSTGPFPYIAPPGLDRRNTAPPEQQEAVPGAGAPPHETTPSAPPMLPSAPPMDDSDPFISSAPAAGTDDVGGAWGGHGVAVVNPYQANNFGGERGHDEDDVLCVICLSAKKEAGFVHGNSVHRCCCVECARDIMEHGGKKCPICRQEIEHVIEHFY